MPNDPGVAELRRMYLDLVKQALRHELYSPPDVDWSGDFVVEEFVEAIREAQASGTLDVRKAHAEGRVWPKFGQTMVGEYRLAHVQQCVETVITEGIPGDLIETGVWRGGVTILMRAVLAAYDVRDRTVFVADSFRGLPAPNTAAYPADDGDVHHTAKQLVVSREEVETNFQMYGLLDDRVQFLEGWFNQTLPTVRNRTWAVIRLDGDMYESTMDGLVNLYSGLTIGGFLIIDDYAYAPCRQAVEDFRIRHGILEPIETVDWTGVYWRRER